MKMNIGGRRNKWGGIEWKSEKEWMESIKDGEVGLEYIVMDLANRKLIIWLGNNEMERRIIERDKGDVGVLVC